ncbi:MAG TPA: CBS domain-containing protein [Myxococcota bacterium]|nr:CBS domain-containing protein [Myxococcota bacterium]
MSVRTYARDSVCTAAPDEPVGVAAERMQKEGIGMLVVVDGERPVGVLTDRDVALCDNAEADVARAMSSPAATLGSRASVAEAAAQMGRRGVRRLPLVAGDGRLAGLIAADDILRLLASEIGALAAVAAAQMPDEPEPAPEPTPGGERPLASHYGGEVVTVRADAPVQAAIAAMKEHAVGCIAVTGESGEPLGLLTDRDVALRAVARGANRATTPVSAVMSSPAITCSDTASVEQVVETMRAHAVRRVLIQREGHLAGIVTFDDLVAALGDDLHRLGESARRQIRREQRRAQAEHVREEIVEKLREAAERLRELGGDAVTALGRELDSLRERIAHWRQ